jgi:hypothetical protein|tara:strand:+ start:404 stop:841 length:438 start_codon:yes stop_codon:yes gene_type:complete
MRTVKLLPRSEIDIGDPIRLVIGEASKNLTGSPLVQVAERDDPVSRSLKLLGLTAYFPPSNNPLPSDETRFILGDHLTTIGYGIHDPEIEFRRTIQRLNTHRDKLVSGASSKSIRSSSPIGLYEIRPIIEYLDSLRIAPLPMIRF